MSVDFNLLLHGVIFQGIREKIISGESLTKSQKVLYDIATTEGTDEENVRAKQWFNRR